ncbi:hypothetical protein Hanom_Chr02g00130901 [Helianthus anomalus]
MILSSAKSITSSEHELICSGYACVGALRDLGADPKGQKPRKVSKKKPVSIAGGSKTKNVETTTAMFNAASREGILRSCQSRLDDYVYVADSMEELDFLGGKFKTGSVGGTKSSGSTGSREQHSSTTPTSTPIIEERKQLKGVR